MPFTASELPFLSNPYTWLAVSALAFGAALARVTRFDTDRTRRWVAFCVLLSLALLLALAAIFTAGPGGLREALPLYFFLAASAVFFLALRFRKSAGVAFLLALLALGFATLLFLQSVRAFTGETEIARVRALSVREEGLTLDLLPPDADPVVVQLEGGYFAPVVRVVIFHDAFVFLGARTWYRFDGLVSFSMRREEGRTVLRQEESVYSFRQPPGISERLYAWLEERDGRIPGIKTVQIEVSLKRPRELVTYSIRVQNDGGVEVVALP